MSVLYYKVQANVCPGQLKEEINDDIGGSPLCEYVRIDDLVNLTISFDIALSGSEETAMDAVIASHVCETIPTDPEGNEIGSGLTVENDGKPLSGDVSTLNFEGLVAVVPDPGTELSTAIIHIGHTEVENNTGSTILANTPVYATGYDVVNGHTHIAPADALVEANMPAIGLLEDDLANGEVGLVVVSGETHGTNTSSFSVGDSLWVAPGGGLTTSRPDNNSQVQKLGTVISVDAVDGKIFVSGAGRVNDLPNLSSGKVWYGDGNDLAVETDIYTEAEVDALIAGITFTHPDPHHLADGTVGAPAYSFSGATDSGWWRETTGDLALSVDGTEIFEVQTDGRVIISSNVANYENLVTADNVIPNKKYVDDAIALISGGGVFGSEFQEASSEGTNSTSSSSYQQKLTLTTGSLPSGEYRIGWYCEVRCNNTSARSQVRIHLNNTTVLGEPSIESEDTDDYVPFSGHKYETLSGANTIDLDYRRQENSGTVCIRYARIEIWRVS